MVQYSRRALVF